CISSCLFSITLTPLSSISPFWSPISLRHRGRMTWRNAQSSLYCPGQTSFLHQRRLTGPAELSDLSFRLGLFHAARPWRRRSAKGTTLVGRIHCVLCRGILVLGLRVSSFCFRHATSSCAG